MRRAIPGRLSSLRREMLSAAGFVQRGYFAGGRWVKAEGLRTSSVPYPDKNGAIHPLYNFDGKIVGYEVHR